MNNQVLQRLVFPPDKDPDVLPLYAEGDAGAVRETYGDRTPGEVIALPGREKTNQVLGRGDYLVPAGHRTSFGTYFNAFPAGYWARYTKVRSVTLVIEASGEGLITVSRSNAKGHCFRVQSRNLASSGPALVEFELPLNTFGDGGWYWFDVIATNEDVRIHRAHWESEPVGQCAGGKATIAITTFNRQNDCVEVLRQLGEDPDLGDVIAKVLVIDQGDKKVKSHPDFAANSAGLGDLLEIVDQPNLGGSGGFARGMFEAVERGSDYVLLLDDDVRVETEGIRRAVVFGNSATEPTIVGGHMFSMYERTKLHAMAEVIDHRRMWWTVATGTKREHDFATESLRATAWLHERADADYNGWWMCLIPTSVIRRIGLSLPLFIKWDDSEYGVRAREAGVPVVSLPGAALWHVPFTAKDDSLEWQAYFHARNRMVAGLLHTDYGGGQLLLLDSFANTVKHVVSAQYSTAHLRDLGMRDLLEGPAKLHQELATAVGRARSQRAEFTDATVVENPEQLIGAYTSRLSGAGVRQRASGGKLRKAVIAAKALAHQLKPVPEDAHRVPQTVVPFPAQRWWTLAGLDSALVSASDSSSMSLYQRDRGLAARQFKRSLALHRYYAKHWESLTRQYREQMNQLVGPRAWARTLGIEYHPQRWEEPAQAAAQHDGASAR